MDWMDLGFHFVNFSVFSVILAEQYLNRISPSYYFFRAIIFKSSITNSKSKVVWNSRNNNKIWATVFLYKVFFYKIIPTYIFNSLNSCLKSVIYDVYGASTGLSVIGSRILGFFCNLAFIQTESKSLFFALWCVFLIWFFSSNYFTTALIYFFFSLVLDIIVILMIIE